MASDRIDGPEKCERGLACLVHVKELKPGINRIRVESDGNVVPVDPDSTGVSEPDERGVRMAEQPEVDLALAPSVFASGSKAVVTVVIENEKGEPEDREELVLELQADAAPGALHYSGEQVMDE